MGACAGSASFLGLQESEMRPLFDLEKCNPRHGRNVVSKYVLKSQILTLSMRTLTNCVLLLTSILLLAAASPCPAQSTNRAGRGFGPQGPRVLSPTVSPERKVTFRILAPKAEAVRLNAGD